MITHKQFQLLEQLYDGTLGDHKAHYAEIVPLTRGDPAYVDWAFGWATLTDEGKALVETMRGEKSK